MNCPDCGKPATLETGKTIYPHRADLSKLYFWACLDCKVWVGCHGTSKTPMGRLANAASRQLKLTAHKAFDPIWKSGYMDRSAAYAWLGRLTGLNADDCHMGKMPDHLLRGIARACTQFCNDKGIR